MVSVLKAAQLPIRVRVIRFPGSGPEGRDFQAMTKEFPSTPTLRVSGTKWIVDATFLERGALMQLPYTDFPQSRGKLNWPRDTVGRMINEGLNSKEQLLLHLLGDSTPKFVLDKMSTMADATTWRKKRVRFEHGYGLTPDQLDRAKNLGIVMVVNPTHFSFGEVLNTRIGAERTSHYQPLRSLIEAGIPVAIGSDIPNNPYLNILFATIHPSNPREAITREQAVMAYTSGSAYAEFAEKVKGKLIKGMLADLAVLSQDIFTIPADQLPVTESVLTIIDGKIVYENSAGANNKMLITKNTEGITIIPW
jgi:predicted amidohydrolase YtcJ